MVEHYDYLGYRYGSRFLRLVTQETRRFANYVPPVMEVLGLAEVEHNVSNNRMRAL